MEKSEWTDARIRPWEASPGTADRNGPYGHRLGVRPRVRAGDARRERERCLGAGLDARTPERRGYANGAKSKRVDTPAGSVTVQVPKTAGHEGEPCLTAIAGTWAALGAPFVLAVAEMYIKGVSTREVEAVMREFGVVCLSSSQVSRAAKLLDEELAARAATARSARSSISSSTRGTRRCAMAAFVRKTVHRTVF